MPVGGVIDASGKGYAAGATYPAAGAITSGGSHLGIGGGSGARRVGSPATADAHRIAAGGDEDAPQQQQHKAGRQHAKR